MKLISLPLFFSGLALASPLSPLLDNVQAPFGEYQRQFTGLELDLGARRLVQLEGMSPVWMTELEKVSLRAFSFCTIRAHLLSLDQGQGSGRPFYGHVSPT